MNSTKLDLYEVIGVPRTATDDEIKKAYKKLAIKCHPDRNPDNQEEANRQFQELNRAAKILTNPESRKRYDQFGVIDGEGDSSGGGMPGGFNPFDIFGNIFNGGGMPGFFGGGGGGGGGMSGQDAKKHSKSPDKKITINLSLSDVYKGKMVSLDFIRTICCDKCNGIGAKSSECVVACNICNGNGRIIKMMQMGPMIQQIVQPCNACTGVGKMIKPGNECSKCSGKKGTGIKRHLDCYVRPGSAPGTHITFKNESDWVPEYGDIGDLIVFINVKNEEFGYRREGDNLIMKRSISLLEALTNTTFFFKHLDGRVIKVTDEDIIHPGKKMVIPKEGMPNLQDNLVKGDLIIIFDVQFPSHLDKERSKYLIKILPPPKKQIWDTQLEATPETDLTSYTLLPFNENKHEHDNNNYTNNHNGFRQQTETTHNDIDDEPHMGPVECTTQ